jgi:molybdenum cofactor biosynthesis enzyme MoaA
MFRLLGGEPTLHKDLLDFVKIGKAYGHIMSIVTNGTLINESLAGQLAYLQPLHIGISFPDEKLINARLQGLYNLSLAGMKRVCIGNIITDASDVERLLDLAALYPNMIKYIHLRTLLKSGKHEAGKTYSLDDLKSILERYTSIKKRVNNCTNDCCQYYDTNAGVRVGLILFGGNIDIDCHFRGVLLPDGQIGNFWGLMRQDKLA